MNARFPGPEAGRRVLCVDFDGTITRADVLATYIQRHARDGWQVFEERWRRGELASVECMRAQLELVDLDPRRTLEFFDSMEVDPDFAPFVHGARRRGLDVMVLSDGLDVYVHRILARLALGPLEVVCNRAARTADGWQLTPPYPPSARDEAGNSKAHHIGLLRGRYDHVTLIGDGLSDRGAARAADLVFAKAELREYCVTQGLPHSPFDSFAGLRALLDGVAVEP